MEHSYWETDSEIYTVLEIKLWLMLVKKNPQNKQLILMLQKCWLLVFFFFLSLVLLFVRSGQTKHWYEVW